MAICSLGHRQDSNLRPPRVFGSLLPTSGRRWHEVNSQLTFLVHCELTFLYFAMQLFMRFAACSCGILLHSFDLLCPGCLVFRCGCFRPFLVFSTLSMASRLALLAFVAGSGFHVYSSSVNLCTAFCRAYPSSSHSRSRIFALAYLIPSSRS